MGTEPARLQERLEAALGPPWGIEREVRLAARLQHPHVVHAPPEVGTALGTPAYMVPEQVTDDPAMDHCADVYALGVMAYELLVGSHPFAGRAPHAGVAIRSRRGGLTWRPRRDRDVDAGLARVDTPHTHVKRTLAPRDSESSTREVVFPPPTGGRFK